MATGCSRISEFRTGFECPVCFDLFDISESAKTPRTLTCNHSFCHECLERIIENDYNQVLCPLCRTCTDVDFGDLSQLPVPPCSRDTDPDVLLLLSLYKEIEDYKEKESLLEDKLKEAADLARQREEKLIKELKHCKMLSERTKMDIREQERQIIQLKMEKEEGNEYQQREQERQIMKLNNATEYHSRIERELNTQVEVLKFTCVFLL